MDMREKEIRERVEALGMKVLKKDVRPVRTELTEEELAALAADVDTHIGKHLELENEKKAIDKKLKDQMDEHEEIFRALSKTRKDGFEDRETEVLIVADVPAKVRRIFSVVTGLQVAQEVMQDSDLQEKMELKEKGGKKAAEAKKEQTKPEVPGTLEIGYEPPKSESGMIEIEGSVIDDEAYQNLGQLEEVSTAPTIEEKKLVTQVRMVEKKDGAYFITTAENEIFFTDKHGDFRCAEVNIERNKQQAEAGTGVSAYVEITYKDTDTRNKQLVEITEREVVTSGEDGEMPLPQGLEVGEDPDGDVAPKTESFDIEEVDDDDEQAPE